METSVSSPLSGPRKLGRTMWLFASASWRASCCFLYMSRCLGGISCGSLLGGFGVRRGPAVMIYGSVAVGIGSLSTGVPGSFFQGARGRGVRAVRPLRCSFGGRAFWDGRAVSICVPAWVSRVLDVFAKMDHPRGLFRCLFSLVSVCPIYGACAVRATRAGLFVGFSGVSC